MRRTKLILFAIAAGCVPSEPSTHSEPLTVYAIPGLPSYDGGRIMHPWHFSTPDRDRFPQRPIMASAADPDCLLGDDRFDKCRVYDCEANACPTGKCWDVAGEQTGHAVRTDRRAWPMPESGPPPHNEVMRLWEACKPVTEDAALSEQLRKRSLWPEGVASIDLARALPDSCAAWPKWAQCGQQTWRESGHRLLFPLWNAKGEHRSLHARLVQKTEGPGKTAKGLFPSGYSAKGLFLADSFARFLLTSGIPPWWRWEEPPSIIVTEGAPDFLTVASHFGEWECVPAVLGVLSGSWSDDLAKQIPDGCRVVVRVHRDEAGKKYRDTICRSLSGRCRVFAEAGEVAHV